MTHISSRTVAVIREDVEHNSRTSRAVTFVSEFFVVAAFRSAEALLDSAVDVVLRNIVGLGLGKSQLQTHITRGVTAAHAYSNGDFTADFRGDTTTDGVVGTFFTFNVGPFGMS